MQYQKYLKYIRRVEAMFFNACCFYSSALNKHWGMNRNRRFQGGEKEKQTQSAWAVPNPKATLELPQLPRLSCCSGWVNTNVEVFTEEEMDTGLQRWEQLRVTRVDFYARLSENRLILAGYSHTQRGMREYSSPVRTQSWDLKFRRVTQAWTGQGPR